MKFLIYDVESKKRVLGPNDTAHPNEVFAASWGDRTDQGISVICALDPDTFKSWVFLDSDLADFALLASGYDCLSGYNIKTYDDKMLEAHGYPIPGIRRYDIMHELRPGNPDGKKAQKLDAILEFNSMPAKQYNGADAPYLYQTGQLGRLITYCLEDVRLEAMLFNRMRAGHPIRMNAAGATFGAKSPTLTETGDDAAF